MIRSLPKSRKEKNMHYVMADLHGEFRKYLEMLEKINFSDNDTLFILGDVIDRGPDPVRILMNMYMRRNVRPIMGNHELMAIKALAPYMDDDNYEGFDKQLMPNDREYLHYWMRNGGDTTFLRMEYLKEYQLRDLYRYMKAFRPYETYTNENGEKFILVHAGFSGYSPDRPLKDYETGELVWERPSFGTTYYGDDITVIVGHTPTPAINGKPEIYKTGNIRFIDCGATFGGSLACLCLDTMEEFYV